MSNAIKVKLDTLYSAKCAGEPNPAHYTQATVEIFSAGSDVTIRATTVPDFDGGFSAVPEVTTEAKEGEVWQCEATRAVRFLSFSCSDSTAAIYVSGFILKELPEPEPSEPEEPGSGGGSSEEPSED